MRITAGAVREEALGEEAAAVVRQAVCLAMQWGHSQVTPLHVASAMLAASPASALRLRAACVRSQSHPLHRTALELCLDVALGQLAVPRSSATSVIHHALHLGPVPSNALVAALRRAQAHQRRRGAVNGGVRGKVELEDLLVSVLDDPGVDRVMRAAGFSGSQIMASAENAAISSDRANRDLATLPAPVCTIRAGGQPSLHTASELHRSLAAHHVQGGGSECQSSKGRQAFFDGSELVATTTTVILPPWLRRYQDIIPTGATGCAMATSRLPVDAARCGQKFTELTAQNLKILCHELELHAPRHRDIIPAISSTMLWCRSGMTRRRKDKPSSLTRMTWMLFRGRDSGGKTAVARELAKLVFGSYTNFTMISAFGTTPTVPSGKLATKRQRSPHDDDNAGYVGSMFFEAILENPHQVILIDGVDRLDNDSEMCIKDAMAEGAVMRRCSGDVVGLADAIVVLCCDVLGSTPRVKKRRLEDGNATGKEVRSCRHLSMDLNAFPHDGEDKDHVSAHDAGILNFVKDVFFFS